MEGIPREEGYEDIFRPIFQVAASRAGSGIRIINEPLETGSKGSSVFLWRREVALYLKHGWIVLNL